MRKRSREPILLLTRWEQKMDDKPCGRLWSDAPRAVALVKTDLAARLMPQGTCKFRAKPESWTSWAYIAPTGQIRPSGWSDSPQWVERFAPVGGAIRPSGWSDLPHPPRPQGSVSRLDRPRQFHPETPLGRAPCDALPSVRSRVPRRAQVSERGDGGTASSRRRRARRGRTWRARGQSEKPSLLVVPRRHKCSRLLRGWF